ncbi:AAA family ATPase [Streptomyces albipurpureus]|uniref:AAA family ATPase n=1 Tax=Streptomyces albipurpureus TaxID=2897419 RepID=A0ABT0V0L5_9ACTN|nr:AAA family ATPase [Streptomyces sp. CWNU-1]MCM2394383.1 AAA family ATPase [Streptomyces sp. CWNU-1]
MNTETTTAALAQLHLPQPALYVLIGAAGAGKSTVAATFPASWRLSLDECRARICDDAGSQDSTPDALRVFGAILEGRLVRRLPTVVDATSTQAPHRVGLIDRAHAYGLPVIAIAVRTDLAICQARQASRPTSRRVPAKVIARQHQDVPSLEALLREGFDQAHDATDLDLMRMLLEHAAAAGPDPHDTIRATFGPDLTDLFTFSDSAHSTGVFAVAGRELTIRYWDAGDPFDHHWQARHGQCPHGCGGTRWARVDDATDLLNVHQGGSPDDVWCDTCDNTAIAASTW